MSCLGKNYNPNPPRAWSRVDSRCQYAPTDYSDNIVYFPYLNEYVRQSKIPYLLQMLSKGNILQYKANSSNLTKQQRYSKIATGMWTNRNTTWATQTQTYTNPNTTSLKRVNYKNITLDGAETTLPLTCPQPYIKPIYNVLPPIYDLSSVVNPPVIPPPPIVQPSSNPPSIPDTYDVPIETPIVIPDGGTFICNVVENICTGEVVDRSYNKYCYPTTDSNVPGPITDLCWNSKIQTWYPRQQYVMPTSGNKFPEGYKFFKPA
jgi:hypothetical protein